MSLQSDILKKICSLKPTVTTFYSSNGEVYEEIRGKTTSFCSKKVNANAPGFIIDLTPDLSVSRILPWLYMGSQDVVYDYDLLKKHGITHILSIGIPSPTYEGITTVFIEAYDFDEFSIIDIFEKCFQVINSAHSKGGIVYVHCNAGVSRSATVVAGYLMQYKQINHLEALEFIKRIRPKIKPNPGFIKQLQEFSSKVA